jgi:hypothetical protein
MMGMQLTRFIISREKYQIDMMNREKALLALAAIFLIGWFSRPISDPDFWWHLRTGQYLWETHRLPVPDPFAYTTAGAPDAYPGEALTRHFNLTHEWAAQALLFLVWRAGGFAGVIIARVLLLVAFCGLAGYVVFQRCGGFYRALAATLAVAAAAFGFAADRPYLVSYLMVGLFVVILESRRRLWLLPPLMILWANCHGGYFLGLVVVGAYAAEALLGRKQAHRALFVAAIATAAVSGLNPNGFHIFEILMHYRASFLTSRLLEWQAPALWPPNVFSVLLAAGGTVLIWQRKRVRIADWLLFAAFAAAALSAQRNTILTGWLAPVLIFSYTPVRKTMLPYVMQAAAALLLAGLALGSYFQFRVEEWRWPSGAADFQLAHGLNGPLFNTWEFGGYLMWRLWPHEKVFIDGRALSESVFQDYARILYNHDAGDGKPDAQQLLARYGVQTIVMNGFEYNNGLTYLLAPALADPSQTEWKLVYGDSAAMIFVRKLPAGVEAQPSLRVLDYLEQQCDAHLTHEPKFPRCARALGQVFSKTGDFVRARRWLGRYIALKREPDAEAEDAWRRLATAGY